MRCYSKTTQQQPYWPEEGMHPRTFRNTSIGDFRVAGGTRSVIIVSYENARNCQHHEIENDRKNR
jgi:hypothetical protein